MRRLAWRALAYVALTAWTAQTVAQDATATFAPVLPGTALHFPRDFGSHAEYGIEWWYVTGWLQSASAQPLGFQITFFRVRTRYDEANPSAFAPRQLLIAQVALSDPQHGRPWQEQRVRRAGLELAEASNEHTDVWVDDWRLQQRGDVYTASASADGFGLQLTLMATRPPLLNGEGGYSRKGPEPLSASEYYSLPHLQVHGVVQRGTVREVVRGEAWLDHEWSSQYLDADAAGWDWVGLNFDDGGALMAFRMRGRNGETRWLGATLLAPDGTSHSLPQQAVRFLPGRRWHSPRSGVDYPVSWQLQLPGRVLQLTPLMDDQEIDTNGRLYWEGAVRVSQDAREIGRGYLELTGYGQPLVLP